MSRLITLAVIALVLGSCATTRFTPTAINEIPMYGKAEFTEGQKDANERFIQAMLADGFTRQTGSMDAVKKGFAYLKRGDFSTSMKRFNQGWLLDADNPEVYSGYGVWYAKQDDYEHAVAMFELGLEKDPRHKSNLHDLGLSYNHWGVQLKYSRPSLAKEYFLKAVEPLEKAIALYPDWGPPYVTISASYMQLEDFSMAVVYAEKAQALKERLEPGYLPYLKSQRDRM